MSVTNHVMQEENSQKLAQMEAIVEKEKDDTRWRSIGDVVDGLQYSHAALQSRGLEENVLMERLQCEVRPSICDGLTRE